MATDKADLPSSPDFAAIELVAPKTADQRTRILAMIGNLVFTWSNNESMFIYLLMILLRTDFSSAAITFVSLNTTRARLDLVRRLAKSRVKDRAVVRRLERMIERFQDCTRVRNEFNHCIYQMDSSGQITHTDVLRITEKKDGLEYAVTRPFDEARLEEISRTVRKLTRLNRDIWEFLPILEEKTRQSLGRPAAGPPPATK